MRSPFGTYPRGAKLVEGRRDDLARLDKLVEQLVVYMEVLSYSSQLRSS
jgi:hypothetical protein